MVERRNVEHINHFVAFEDPANHKMNPQIIVYLLFLRHTLMGERLLKKT